MSFPLMRQGLLNCLALAFLLTAPAAHALSGGSTIAPTGSADPGWANVGTVNSNGYSCVYLGSYASGYWVISAAHVISSDTGSVTINGSSYSVVSGSGVQLSNVGNSTYPFADLYLFRVAGDSALASLSNLTLASSTPNPASSPSITTIGWGGGVESYGTFTLTSRNNAPGAIAVTGSGGGVLPYQSTLLYGTSSSVALIAGDSGGAMFYKSGNTWQLVGINEASSYYSNPSPPYTSVGSQISTYYSQIDAYITAVPEPATCGLMAGGAALTVALVRRRRRAA